MPQHNADSTAEKIVKYSTSNLYRRVLGVINAIIKPKLLTPELFGLWSLIALISSYATHSDFGARVAMRYRIPFHQGRQEQNEIAQIESTTLFGSLLLRILLIVGLLLTAAVVNMRLEVKVGLATLALIVLIQWYHGFYISVLKSYQKFSLISHANYIKASITAFVGLPFLYLFNIYGAYLTALLAFIGPLIYLRHKHHLPKPKGYNQTLFISLVKQGFPIMIFNLLLLLIGSSDRFLVAAFLGTEQLGYYAIAGMVFGALIQIPNAAREIMEPQLMQHIGSNTDDGFERYFQTPLLATAYLSPFFIGPSILLLPTLLELLLPRYLPAVLPAQLILLGGYFVALAYVTRGLIVAENRQLRAALLMTLALLVNLLLSTALLFLGFGLTGVAIGSSFAFLLLFSSLFLFVHHSHPRQNWRQLTAPLGRPFFSMTLLLFCSQQLIRWQTGSLPTTIFCLALYCLLMLLLLERDRHRYPLLSAIDFNHSLKKLPLFGPPLSFAFCCLRFHGLRQTMIIEFRNLIFFCSRYLLRRPLLQRSVHSYRMLLSTQLKGISKSLYLFGRREEDHRLMMLGQLNAGGQILDIGANIGYYALLEASLVGSNGHVYAIEPDPLNLELLHTNITLNGWQERISVTAKAVSKHSGRRMLHRAEKSNCSYLTEPQISPPAAECIEVETLSIAELLRDLPQLNLIRMDLEGQEVDIFHGLITFLQTSPEKAPRAIIFEAHPWKYDADRWNLRPPLSTLFELGYHVEMLSTNDEQNSPPRDAGYPCQQQVFSDFHCRGIYRDISSADALNFLCNTGGIRTVLLKQKG